MWYAHVVKAIVLLRWRLSRRAGALIWKLCSAAMARMRSFVSAAISGLSFSARETVDFDPPARRATSAIVWTAFSSYPQTFGIGGARFGANSRFAPRNLIRLYTRGAMGPMQWARSKRKPRRRR